MRRFKALATLPPGPCSECGRNPADIETSRAARVHAEGRCEDLAWALRQLVELSTVWITPVDELERIGLAVAEAKRILAGGTRR